MHFLIHSGCPRTRSSQPLLGAATGGKGSLRPAPAPLGAPRGPGQGCPVVLDVPDVPRCFWKPPSPSPPALTPLVPPARDPPMASADLAPAARVPWLPVRLWALRSWRHPHSRPPSGCRWPGADDKCSESRITSTCGHTYWEEHETVLAWNIQTKG